MAGRPSKYKEEYCEEARGLCLLGYTDENLAKHFNVSESTLNVWKIKYPDFMESLKNGKERADQEIVQALYDKAKDGDTTAMIFWLKNRQTKAWRDKHNLEHTGKDGGPIEITELIVDPKGE